MKKLTLIVSAAALAACSETVYNASPSIFPPVEGARQLPSQAQGFYQGRSDEFVRQLTDTEQAVWDVLAPGQRVEVARYLRAGGTMTSALRDEQLFAQPDTGTANQGSN